MGLVGLALVAGVAEAPLPRQSRAHLSLERSRGAARTASLGESVSLDPPISDADLLRIAETRKASRMTPGRVPINTQLVRKSRAAKGPTPHGIKIKMAIAAAKRRAVEFRVLCRESGLPLPTIEHRFHGERDWRFDFCWLPERCALECDGGLFVGGGHNRGQHIMRTHEKLNAAALDGWRMFYTSPDRLCKAETIALLRRALGRATDDEIQVRKR